MNPIKERPILYCTDMVRGILAGRKTKTRRVIKQAPVSDINHHLFRIDGGWNWQVRQQGVYPSTHLENPLFCPYGNIGDLFWVRETWGKALFGYEDRNEEELKTVYKADFQDDYQVFGGWHPSMYMKKEDARIWLEIADIQAERLQDITEEDAIKEGIYLFEGGGGYKFAPGQQEHDTARDAFFDLWDQINGQDQYKS